MGFIDIFNDVKKKGIKKDDYNIIDLTGDKPKPFKPSKKQLAKWKAIDKKYPVSLSVDIPFTRTTANKALDARDEISEAWSKFGSWVGQGADLGGSGECDVQVLFKEKDCSKSKAIANAILKKHGVTGEYTTFRS